MMGKVRKGSQWAQTGQCGCGRGQRWAFWGQTCPPHHGQAAFSPCCHPRRAGCSWPGREEEEEGTGLGVSPGGNGLEPLLALALRGNPWQLLPSPTLSFPPPWMREPAPSLGGCSASHGASCSSHEILAWILPQILSQTLWVSLPRGCFLAGNTGDTP